MNQITVRGVPPEVEKAILKESKRQSISINKAVVLLLMKAAGVEEQRVQKRKTYHDLDVLFGSWSKDEADEFERNIKDQEQIDEEVWK